MRCSKQSFLFDHLIGGEQQSRRHCQSERLGRPEINHEFEFCWLLNRQVAGALAIENSDNICGDLAVQFDAVGRVGSQASRLNIVATLIHRRHSVGRSSLDNHRTMCSRKKRCPPHDHSGNIA